MPHLINHLAAENPFHTTTILQLYFISIQMGDITSGNVFRVDSLYSLASSYITRVLYTFEKEFIYQFKTLLLKNKTKYVCKLSYYRYENRPFFIAIWAWMGLIMRKVSLYIYFDHFYHFKGCWRTSLEMGKFLGNLTIS